MNSLDRMYICSPHTLWIRRYVHYIGFQQVDYLLPYMLSTQLLAPYLFMKHNTYTVFAHYTQYAQAK